MKLSDDKLEVLEYLRRTDDNVFITGKAGSGKTTLLKAIVEEFRGRSAVVAPTGVAALNAGGVTIHSMFKLPISPYKPMFIRNQSMSMLPRYSLMDDEVEVVKALDMLIIDEISMVRSDLMDALNDAMCFYRESKKPFGGVRLLMIGDPFQLPPVVIQDEWDVVSGYYDSPYFYDSHALKISGFKTFNLTTIFRQKEGELIDMLNTIRYGNVSREDLNKVNQLYNPNAKIDKDWVTLTSTNFSADKINKSQMGKLQGEMKTYKADVRGNFNIKDATFSETLQIKPGAQVMMLINDPAGEFVNGTIGTYIRSIPNTLDDGDDLLEVKVDDRTVLVGKYQWSKFDYVINESTNSVEAKEVGTAEQYPLKPAWAITIHKSQGLTFDKLAIQAGDAFAHGQVYVALSRGRTLDGIVLLDRIRPRNVKCDQRLSLFAKSLGI